jgi:hypothetical protein
MTKEGHRYPLGNRPKCEVCGSVDKLKDNLCKECTGLMSETSQIIMSSEPDTVEGRRIRNHSSFYVQNRYKYWEHIFDIEYEEQILKAVLLRYKECGPAYVPRSS